MDELDGRAGAAGHPPIAPARHRDDDGVEVAALLRQPVLEAWRPVLVAHAFEDAVRDELPEPVGEAVAGRAEVALEVLEATDAEERVAQDEKRPAVADDRQRPRDGAAEIADVRPAHGSVPFGNLLGGSTIPVNGGPLQPRAGALELRPDRGVVPVSRVRDHVRVELDERAATELAVGLPLQ